MNRYVLSEGDVLRKIKKLQYRAQILPLVMIAVSFWLTITLGHFALLRIFSMALTLLGLGAFFLTATRFRFRNRIVAPDQNSIYVPITGKVAEIRQEDLIQVIVIQKRSTDPVEIRCPSDDCIREAGNLVIKQEGLEMSFSAPHLLRIEQARMKAGEVVSLMIGKGSCRIQLPLGMPTLLKAGDVYQAGESRICLRTGTISCD